MRGVITIIHRIGVWPSTLLLVFFIIIAALGFDVLIHNMLHAPMMEPFILADTLIASLIGIPISYALLRMLVQIDLQREALIKANQEINTLEDMLPLCSGCKKIRDEQGQWLAADDYLEQNTRTSISHGLCPECEQLIQASIPETR